MRRTSRRGAWYAERVGLKKNVSAHVSPQSDNAATASQTMFLPEYTAILNEDEKRDMAVSKSIERQFRSVHKPFLLMPTPAQRGMKRANIMTELETVDHTLEAPAQGDDPLVNSTGRDIGRTKEARDRVLDQVDFQSKSAQLPEFANDYMKNANVGSLLSTPPQLFRSFTKRVSDVPGTTHLISAGSDFLGPTLNKSDMGSGDDIMPCSSSDEKSDAKRLLERRRLLVCQLLQSAGLFPSSRATTAFQLLHSRFFPSKQSLILKIREVRQKIMNAVKTVPYS
ncbi:hypothetical protein GCK32_014360, partial [Trichostrongylus colubriformis]